MKSGGAYLHYNANSHMHTHEQYESREDLPYFVTAEATNKN